MSKLSVLYDKDLDYLEVATVGKKSYASQVTDQLSLFIDEETEEVIGFSLELATNNLYQLQVVGHQMRLAGLVKMTRIIQNKNQDEFAEQNDLGNRTLQRIETGEANLTIDSLVTLVNNNRDIDLSLIIKPTISVNDLKIA